MNWFGPSTRSERQSIRHVRHARAAAALTALLVLPSFILDRSTASFFDTTTSPSNSFTADTVAAPTGLIAGPGVGIDLSWTSTVTPYADGHRVYRSTSSGGPYTQIAEITPASTTAYSDSSAVGTRYYVVRAFAGSWESANSNEASATAVLPAAAGSYTGNGLDDRALTGLGFEPVALFIKCSCDQQGVVRTSTMTGDSTKRLDEPSEALVADRIQSTEANGFTVGTSPEVNQLGDTYHFIAFKASPDLHIGTYVGDDTADRSITGTGFQPAMVTTFADGDASIYHLETMGIQNSYRFTTGGLSLDKILRVEPDGFAIGGHNDVNDLGTTYHYVAWQASTSTHQGSYIGDDNDNRSITGTGFQPDFVWIKRDASAMGRIRFATHGSDQSTRWDATAIEADTIQDFETDGFQIGSHGSVNSGGDEHHYVAFDATPVTVS